MSVDATRFLSIMGTQAYINELRKIMRRRKLPSLNALTETALAELAEREGVTLPPRARPVGRPRKWMEREPAE